MTRSAAAAGPRGPVDLTALAAALREASAGDDLAVGTLVASAEGLVLATEVDGAQGDMIAAMSAIVAGIAAQLADQAGVGETRSCLIEGASGHVAVFPLPKDMVLVVFSHTEVSTGLFAVAARAVLGRLRPHL